MRTTGLTLKEAVESGKLLRRKDWAAWHHVVNNQTHMTRVDDGFGGLISVRDAIADDWEIKVEPREFWLLPRNGLRPAAAFFSREEAEEALGSQVTGLYSNAANDTIIHVKEVLK